MAKKIVTKGRAAPVKNKLTKAEARILNDITTSALGFNPMSIGMEISQTDGLYKSNRWYLLQNQRALLSELYVENGLVQTAIDVPVDDALRGGIEIKTKQLDPDQIEQLQTKMDEEEDLRKAGELMKWNRLFGGSGLITMTEYGDPEEDFDIEEIKEGEELTFEAADLYELLCDINDDDPNLKASYHVEKNAYYRYYRQNLNKTRVKKLVGIRAPSFVRQRLRSWGLSVVEAMVRSINQYLKATAVTFQVLDEFKVDYYKIKNLANNLIQPAGQAKLQNRIASMNQSKNYQNAVVMDSEDDFIQKELAFTGIAETMTGIRMQVASDLRMPLTKLFGVSSAGFNSGEDDIENYNAMVESGIRSKIKYPVIHMVKCRSQQLFGFVPDDLKISFKPLRMLSSVEEENVKTSKFARLIGAKQANEITSEEFRDACNKDNLLGIQLETDRLTMDLIEEEKTPEPIDVTSQKQLPKSREDAPEAKE